MREPKRKQTIKEWEIETGIKVREPKGFTGAKNKINTNKYTKEGYKRGIEKSYITIKSKKGIEFINGENEDNEQWKSYIKANARRK